MLFSFPSNAFLGMHLMATSRWVVFSSARNTSENAPLEDRKDGVSAIRYLTSPSNFPKIKCTHGHYDLLRLINWQKILFKIFLYLL